MLLIGFRNVTSSTGNSEDALAHVTHQRVDIIAGSPSDDAESLSQLYHSMVKKGNESLNKLSKLRDELEFNIDITLEEWEKIEDELLKDIQILKYDKVIITEGLILK
jgi:hypothetical protein